MNDHDACIILNMLNGIGGLHAWKPRRGAYVTPLLKACGSISAILDLAPADICRIGGIGAEQAERIPRWREFADLDRELESAKQAGVTILCRTDDDYPESLLGLDNPPLCLYLLGALPSDLAGKSVAIVGTRTPSDRGVRMAAAFAKSAVSAGWATVSGLALGIDTAAHRATLDAGGRTVAVLGSAIADVYPAENADLAREIVRSGGAVVSEYPMDTRSTRNTLTRRNRIIAGLSRCTLVVEAAASSGALMTAQTASKLGCRVFAVPGAEDDPMAAGTNGLIRQGAKPADKFEDILDSFD